MLAHLFPGVSVEKFRDQVFTKQAAHAHGELARFGLGPAASLLRAPGLFAASHMSRITAYLKGHDGETRQVSVPPDVAATLYEAGATVEVPDVSDFFAPVARLAHELAVELGELPGHAVAIATPPGHDAVPMHFDRHDVFVLQLSGSKRWVVAPSVAPRFPLHSFSPTLRGGQRDGDRWQSYFPEQFPSAMPEGAETFVLRPGSVAYVPAGHWHATSSEEGSVSITLGIAPPRFLELFLAALSSRLIDEPELRRPLTGSQGRDRGRQESTVRRLLALAQELTAELSVEDVLPTAAACTTFERVSGASLRITMTRGQLELVLQRADGERPLAVLDREPGRFVAQFNELSAPLSGTELMQLIANATTLDGWELLNRLEASGAVRRCAAEARGSRQEVGHAAIS